MTSKQRILKTLMIFIEIVSVLVYNNITHVISQYLVSHKNITNVNDSLV